MTYGLENKFREFHTDFKQEGGLINKISIISGMQVGFWILHQLKLQAVP